MNTLQKAISETRWEDFLGMFAYALVAGVACGALVANDESRH
jgi:hypothetical protein